MFSGTKIQTITLSELFIDGVVTFRLEAAVRGGCDW